MAIIHLTDESFGKEIASGVTLVDFWADWCGPCKMIAPVIEELADEYDGRVTVGKVNTDDYGEIAESLGITGIPTVILFRDGKEVTRLIGVREKEEYVAALA
ncbi:MAG: thioredoxin [Oscillospiraceae bacterium]|jgi:thioredoxin 1|nr:thioredoxin [Oscillospiraceae bacterium]